MSAQLGQLMLLPEYREKRPHIFPSQSSIDWFIRKNREPLVKAGALLMLTGRWFADIEKFDACVLECGSKAAESQAAQHTGA